MLFDIPKDLVFPEFFGLKQYFWFSSSILGPKMNQNCKLCVRSIWVKIKIFEGFWNTVFALFEDYLWSKLTTVIV